MLSALVAGLVAGLVAAVVTVLIGTVLLAWALKPDDPLEDKPP